ncbi:flagellar type III secretion system pore protein FliP [Arenibaculum sp.]|jgi:flagellar biosynthetic protein FliP|uniref:flagellar type III secretion system pore protein FliP n=1 Tax=Arenibaculum sp. TaxID=2865862 RepID=UPI002E0F796C|nr:flagellar type III secretion system pore protein FliP [Arenibaculum sp.]HEV7368017.1 flagellar type III secretion system pore protein FliP [Arenibaculum sp.]
MKRLLPLAAAAALLAAGPAAAQSLSLDFGDGAGSTTAQIVQIFALLTILSLAPSILIMVTSFVRIVVVLSFLRTAMGVQQTPPNTVMVSLALFLTFFVMAPVLQQSYSQGIVPLINEEVEPMDGFALAMQPVHGFMMRQVREEDLFLFAEMARLGPIAQPEETPLHVLIPAFMISELRRAFEIGFLLFLPFLIIDMVVASILMSMGMMMLPPIMIAMPFKIIFFVLVDGWHLIAGTLVQSFGSASPL